MALFKSLLSLPTTRTQSTSKVNGLKKTKQSCAADFLFNTSTQEKSCRAIDIFPRSHILTKPVGAFSLGQILFRMCRTSRGRGDSSPPPAQSYRSPQSSPHASRPWNHRAMSPRQPDTATRGISATVTSTEHDVGRQCAVKRASCYSARHWRQKKTGVSTSPCSSAVCGDSTSREVQ